MRTVITTLLLLAVSSVSAGEPDAPGKSAPWKGKAHEIPGVIEAEHYDEGPEGVAYHDTTPKNEGVAYRGETGVDIEGRPDASNLHGIGWTRTGEWLLYTVDVKEAGTYTVEFPVASKKKGGVFHLEFNGQDVTGKIEVPDTGAWTKLQTISKTGVKLKKGVQILKLSLDTSGESGSIGDIDLMRFTRTGD
ncbi:MAG TPA: carbohydrate-binding protein [Planctomycetota bacterium]|nr:carbohydrate-binding protein [Planctomycetota bacterium]